MSFTLSIATLTDEQGKSTPYSVNTTYTVLNREGCFRPSTLHKQTAHHPPKNCNGTALPAPSRTPTSHCGTRAQKQSVRNKSATLHHYGERALYSLHSKSRARFGAVAVALFFFFLAFGPQRRFLLICFARGVSILLLVIFVIIYFVRLDSLLLAPTFLASNGYEQNQLTTAPWRRSGHVFLSVFEFSLDEARCCNGHNINVERCAFGDVVSMPGWQSTVDSNNRHCLSNIPESTESTKLYPTVYYYYSFPVLFFSFAALLGLASCYCFWPPKAAIQGQAIHSSNTTSTYSVLSVHSMCLNCSLSTKCSQFFSNSLIWWFCFSSPSLRFFQPGFKICGLFVFFLYHTIILHFCLFPKEKEKKRKKGLKIKNKI